ncbi:MAG: hypothetical protein ABI601_08950 [bacterium]
MRTMSRGALALIVALAAPAASRAQAAHPDFSGTYALDPAQSDQGQMVPSKLIQKITQTPTDFLVDRAQTNQMGETTVKLKYAFTGTSVNELNIGGNPVEVSTVVTWEADTPVFTSTLKFGDAEIKQVDKWTLSDAGKKLTINRSFDRGGEVMANKLVLVRQ